MKQKLLNIGKNSLKRKNFSVMAHKVITRLKEHSAGTETEMRAWCSREVEPYIPFLESLDKALWDETKTVCADLKNSAELKLQKLGKDLGGSGNYHILYFMTRYMEAKTVVETGVAAGWSSQAILTALQKNENNGHLYSSDFPYFRYENPEKLVGYVVDNALKQNWTLHIDGDENNLPRIAKNIRTIDIFHYDSDKSYSGREFAYEAMSPFFTNNTLIIFDDIQDNFHFRDWVEKTGHAYKVFEFENKFVGLAGGFLEKA